MVPFGTPFLSCETESFFRLAGRVETPCGKGDKRKKSQEFRLLAFSVNQIV
jgi:hypothetical protein